MTRERSESRQRMTHIPAPMTRNFVPGGPGIEGPCPMMMIMMMMTNNVTDPESVRGRSGVRKKGRYRSAIDTAVDNAATASPSSCPWAIFKDFLDEDHGPHRHLPPTITSDLIPIPSERSAS